MKALRFENNQLKLDKIAKPKREDEALVRVLKSGICNADGSNLRQITFQYTPKLGSSFPNWSPDGKQLIYTNDSQAWTIDLTKTWQEQQAPRKVIPAEIGDDLIVWDWSPDGKKLAGMLSSNQRVIAVYSLETKRLERIVENIDTVPSWLPDSRRIVYASGNNIVIADTETKKNKEILSLKPENVYAAFVSRDGRLLYYSVHSGESNIWLLDVSPNP